MIRVSFPHTLLLAPRSRTLITIKRHPSQYAAPCHGRRERNYVNNSKQPEEGDVWAVLDRQWWLRWQRYTGCDEGSPPSKDAAENPQSSRTVGSDNDGIREEGRRSSPEFAGNGNGSGQDSGVPLRERGEGVRGVGNSGVNPGGGSGDHGVGVGQEGIGVVRDGSEVGSAVESDREGMRDDDSRDVTLMPPNVNGKKSGGEGIERGGESAADPLVEADRAAGTLDKGEMVS